jgi:predicted nuclease with RNAse H fold
VPLASVYVGIDVACAAGKPLPICVVSAGYPLMPLTIPKHLARLIPRGVGNKEIAAAAPFQEAARGVLSTINCIVVEMGWQVERIAVDAPAAPPATGSRASENELGRRGLSSFRTPATSAWAGIRQQCANHLGLGGSMATLPHANKIWMLFGFELFACLKSGLKAEVIEVYPFAIVRELLPACEHKSTQKGYRDQLDAVAARTGWEPQNLEARLKATVPGSRHDRLDAFMAAWVASLPPEGRRAFGDAQRPDDAIWVPL